MNLQEYPKELIKKRNEIEGNFVMSLFKQPELIDEYNNIKNGEDILTEDAIFYYGIAQNMYKLGYQVLDNVSICTYLHDKDSLKAGFERRGGFKTIQDITSIINIENIETNYDELIKNNMLLRLYEAGFPVMQNLKKLNEMNSEEIYDFFDFKLNKTVSEKIEKIKSVSLSDGYDSFIKELNQGEQIGFPIASPMLNKRLLGIHRGSFMLWMAHSGKGKTSTAIIQLVLPNIEQGNNVLILANEQSEKEFRLMVLPCILYNKIGYFKVNRSRISQGNFDDELNQKLIEAANWLKEDGRGNIELVVMSDYNISKIKKKVKQFSKLGYGLVILDTLKPEKENSEKAWAEFSEAAKSISLMARKENIGFVATAQLTPSSITSYYLSENDIGKGKAIIETAAQLVQFRFLFNDEKERLKPYTFKKDENGKYVNIKELHDLDINKTYIVIFTGKNRWGDTDTQIVCEYNPSFLMMKDVGWVNISANGSHK